MPAEAQRVRVAVDGHVAIVTLARPERHNALDLAMFDGIRAAAEQVAGEPGVRAVVLHGDGASFCSGLDIQSIIGELGIEAFVAWVRGDGGSPNRAQRAGHDWLALPIPVIAAVHGACFGGGLQIALGADIRIAAPDARLSVMEVRWGLIPDMSITRTLPRLVASDVARELTYTGRVLDGDEAHRVGLVTKLADDPLAAALALADEIAQRSPEAVRAAKRLYEQSWAGERGATLALEAELQLALLGSPNQLEAVAAGLERREPRFTDPR
ncbi:MAG: crotonase/enoyl-CoA hydratase family protein [Solirubrobacteraceae bacterium]